MMTTRIGNATLAAAREGAVWFEPPALAGSDRVGPAPVVIASGPDARRFCNGMFTNNVRDLPVGGANRSAVVDDRGRIGGFLDLLCQAEDRFVLVLDGLTGPAFLERYEKYVVFDDVTLEDATGRWSLLSVQGPRVDLAAIGLVAPEPGRFTDGEPLIWRRVRSPAGGFDLLATDRDRWATALGRIAAQATADEAEVLRVLAGRPAFPADTGDKRLPAEIGLRDELLSFDKGCYIGQESINRIDVMGDVKRRLIGVRLPGAGAGGDTPPAGATVVADGAAGELTSPVVLPNGDVVGLAVLKRPADQPGTAVRVEAEGRSWDGRVEAFPIDG